MDNTSRYSALSLNKLERWNVHYNETINYKTVFPDKWHWQICTLYSKITIQFNDGWWDSIIQTFQLVMVTCILFQSRFWNVSPAISSFSAARPCKLILIIINANFSKEFLCEVANCVWKSRLNGLHGMASFD